MYRTVLMMLYATGLRRTEMCDLKIAVSPLTATISLTWRVKQLLSGSSLRKTGSSSQALRRRRTCSRYAHGGKKKVMTVSAHEFLRRFLMIRPNGGRPP
jgi:site-specific recombinase XerD